MRFSSMLLSGVLLLSSGTAWGKSLQVPDGLRGAMDAAALEGRLEYPKSAVAAGISGIVLIYWYPATREHPARAVIASGNRMAFIGAVKLGLWAIYPEITINNVINSMDDEQRYEVVFAIDSTGGEYTGHVHIRTRAVNLAIGKADTVPIPDMDEFVAVNDAPVWNQSELERHIVYPVEADINNIEGMVVVRVLIGSTGTVLDTHIDRIGNPLLAAAAVDAVTGNHFTPARQGGHPVPYWMQLPVTFRKTGR